MSRRHGRGRRGGRGPRGRGFWWGGPHGPNADAWREHFARFLGQPPENHWMLGGRRFKPWLAGEPDFNPFVAMAFSKGGGLLPLYVLHLLRQAPRYGNEVMSLITERTGGTWVTNPGAIYPLLTLLEEHGLIRGEWEDPTRRTVRVYAITDAGQAELDRLGQLLTPKLREALDVLGAVLDDLDSDDDATPDDPADNDNP